MISRKQSGKVGRDRRPDPAARSKTRVGPPAEKEGRPAGSLSPPGWLRPTKDSGVRLFEIIVVDFSWPFFGAVANPASTGFRNHLPCRLPFFRGPEVKVKLLAIICKPAFQASTVLFQDTERKRYFLSYVLVVEL